MIHTLEWKTNYLRIIDQTKLPLQTAYVDLRTIEDVFEAIRKLRVRGAPAIGIAAAYGLYLGLQDTRFKSHEDFIFALQHNIKYLSSARPTGVNLFWALEKIKNEINLNFRKDLDSLKNQVKILALNIHKDDQTRCENIAQNGQTLINQDSNVLTYCNTGALATGGIGTALGVIIKARESSKNISVYACETRPLLQGARLTTWELKNLNIPVTLICDNMAAWLMKQKKVDLVIVGADRISLDGSVANKIGTYNLAVLAHHHHIPFYVAAPLSTFDHSIRQGDSIPIEMRDCEEVRKVLNQYPISDDDIECWNPAFDVTPSSYITAIITEKSILHQPNESQIKKLLSNKEMNQRIRSIA
jgi:methylthioribose-1-phosphate isomerase